MISLKLCLLSSSCTLSSKVCLRTQILITKILHFIRLRFCSYYDIHTDCPVSSPSSPLVLNHCCCRYQYLDLNLSHCNLHLNCYNMASMPRIPTHSLVVSSFIQLIIPIKIALTYYSIDYISTPYSYLKTGSTLAMYLAATI